MGRVGVGDEERGAGGSLLEELTEGSRAADGRIEQEVTDVWTGGRITRLVLQAG